MTDGADNQTMVNGCNRRCVIYDDPATGKPWSDSQFKRQTGSSFTNTRALYSNKTQHDWMATMFIGINKTPKLSFQDPAVFRRIVVIIWESVFTADEAEIDEENHVYPRNGYFTTKDYYARSGAYGMFWWIVDGLHRMLANNIQSIRQTESMLAVKKRFLFGMFYFV